MSNTVAGTEANFEAEVLKSEELVLVDFWAPWCGPCRLVGPVLDELADENAGKLKVVKVNVDENSALSQRYEIKGIPTMKFFKGGVEVGMTVGAAMKDSIQEKIDSLL